MPQVLGAVNIDAELRLIRPNGTSSPITEWATEVGIEHDTYQCFTWIDLDSLDADPVEYLVRWRDLALETRAHRGRLVVDGEPVANGYINPWRNQNSTVIDHHRLDDQYCTRLEFTRLQPTNQTGSDVRTLGAMAGIVKLEIEIGWFQYEDVRKITFKRIEPTHPLLDARPVNAAGLAAGNQNGRVTHTSKFGRIFTKPFRLPGSGPNGAPLQTQFRASPPPIRNRPTGRGGKRPFAVFYWIVGRPAHLEEPDLDQAPTSPLANGPGWDRSTAPSPASVTGRDEWKAYHRDQADGAASGSGTTGQVRAVKAEADVKSTLAIKTLPAWSNTHLTSIDLTLDTDSDSSSDDDDEVDDLIMDSGLYHLAHAHVLVLPTIPAAVQSRSTSTTRSTSRDDRTASPTSLGQRPRLRTIASAPPPTSSSQVQGSPRLQRKTSAPPSGSKRASSVEEKEEEEPLFRASSLEIKDEDGEGKGGDGTDEEKEDGRRVGGGKRRKVSRTQSGGESDEDDE